MNRSCEIEKVVCVPGVCREHRVPAWLNFVFQGHRDGDRVFRHVGSIAVGIKGTALFGQLAFVR